MAEKLYVYDFATADLREVTQKDLDLLRVGVRAYDNLRRICQEGPLAKRTYLDVHVELLNNIKEINRRYEKGDYMGVIKGYENHEMG